MNKKKKYFSYKWLSKTVPLIENNTQQDTNLPLGRQLMSSAQEVF